MTSLRYPGMAPMAGGAMHMMPSIETLNNAAAAAAASVAAEPQPPSSSMNLLPYSSRVGGNKTSSCLIYRYDDARGASEHKSHQMCTADGRVFVEHVPNHSIVYVPTDSPVDHMLRDLRKPRSGQSKQHKQSSKQTHAYAQAPLPPQYSQPMHYDPAMHYEHHQAAFMHHAGEMQAPLYDQAQPPMPHAAAKQHIEPPQLPMQLQMQMQMPAKSTPAPAVRKPKEKSAKPINAFIKYRSYKIAELKKQHPEVSQTDISRLAGECWKNEDEEIKARFREQYVEEKKLYDLKKITTKRARDASEAPSDTDGSVADSAHPESGSITAPLPSDAGALGLPHGFDPKRRRRSLTLPPSSAAEPPRAASSSPMLTAKTPKRRCITVDMRKQLAKASFPPHAADGGLSRAHSMNDAVAAAASMAQYDVGMYGSLGFATPVMHPADVGGAYLDMSPMRLPVNQTFSLPPALTSMPPQAAADSLAPMATFGPAAMDENAAAVVAAAAAAAFDLYTSENEDLVAASISSLVASTQAAASSPELAVSGALVATSTPLAVGTDMLSTMPSDYFGSPQHHQ
ncbi:hypothetical protein GGI05_003989 [Coemansia sp. RSA 2603]|nr:hypothetical protein GGI05_003989 [Coemansia sp. RSA 2603]